MIRLANIRLARTRGPSASGDIVQSAVLLV